MANGGKIIFERVNPGSEPTAKDNLVSQLHNMEKSGQIDAGSTSKVEKFFSGASKALDFFMHNKKFQTAVGLIACGAFIAGGCVCPVLLIGVGPAVLVFANGFIDNPMLTAPEGTSKPTAPGSSSSNPAQGNQSNQGNGNNGTGNPKVKSKGRGGLQSSNSSGDDDPGARPVPKTVGNKKPQAHDDDDDDDDPSVTGVAKTVVRRASDAGLPLQPYKLGNDGGFTPLKAGGMPTIQDVDLRNKLEELENLENLKAYIDAQADQVLGRGGEQKGLQKTKDAIYKRVIAVKAQYNHVEADPAAEGIRAAPSGLDTLLIRNALTREVIDQLLEHVKQHGHLPAAHGKQGNLGLITNAATQIGMPVSAASEGGIVHRILGGNIHNYTAALDSWCKRAGIPVPKRK